MNAWLENKLSIEFSGVVPPTTATTVTLALDPALVSGDFGTRVRGLERFLDERFLDPWRVV